MDLAAIAGDARRIAPADARTGIDRLAISLRALMPIIESSAVPELARDLRGARTDRAILILPNGGAARIEVDGRSFVIPAALRDRLRAAIDVADTVSARPSAPPPSAATPGAVTPGTVASSLGTSAHLPPPATTLALAHAHEPLASALPNDHEPEVAARAASVVVRFEDLLDAETMHTGAAAQRLQSAVQRSGLFFESHVAAWVRGHADARAADTLRTEARQLGANELPLTGAPAGTRAPAQLEVLNRDAIALNGAAWTGQPAQIELRREAHPESLNADGHSLPEAHAAVFGADLRLELPRLGALRLRLRLSGEAIAVTAEHADPTLIERHFPALAAQLGARGLIPVALGATELK